MRQSELLFRTVFETSPDAIVITRLEDNVIIDVNHRFTDYTGLDRQKVIGRPVDELELWQDPDQRKLLLKQVDEKGFVEDWEAIFRTKQARLITCLLSTKRIRINDKPHIHTVALDISDRKQYEKQLYAANLFLLIGNSHSDIHSLLSEFVEEVKKVSGCSAAAIRIVDQSGKIPYVYSDGFDDDFCSTNEPLSLNSNKGMCIRVIKNLRTLKHTMF